jgi:hypothetical protein
MRCHSVIAVLALSQLTLAQARAQWAEDRYVEQSLMRCFESAERYVENERYGYASGVSLVGSFMAPGESFTFDMYFEGHRDLMIIAAGDDDAIDVDLRVHDPKGGLVAEDTAYDEEGLVEFSTGRAATYTVEVELYSADADSFVSFVLLDADGGYIPFHDLELAMDNMLDMWRGGDVVAERDGIELNYNRSENQPCLFGALLQGDTQVSLTGLNFDSGEMMAFAGGDSDVEDIDLVLNGDRGDELVADRLRDAHPVITHRTSSRRTYEVVLVNAAAAGTIPTFAIVSLVQVR